MLSIDEAIKVRVSRRAFLDEEISNDIKNDLKQFIADINSKSQLSIEYLEDGRDFFSNFFKSYGFISNAKSVIVLKGDTSINFFEEKIGYFGEMVLIRAVRHDLGTCWVGGSLNKKAKSIKLNPNEKIVCVIPIGYVKKEKTVKEQIIYNMTARKRKKIEDFYESDSKELPPFFLDGIEFLSLAPSAMNKQPVKIEYKDNIITASVVGSYSGFKRIDLGIAKLHFELGAKNGYFGFGNEAKYTFI